MNATPHVAQNANGRSSAIDGRTTRHAGYAVSQRIRKRIEEAFGWIKTIAGQERTRLRGRERVGWAFTFAAAATIWCGCPSSWPPHERPRQVRVDRPLADLRGRYLGSRSPRPLRAGEADDHPRRAAKSPSAPWRPVSKSNMRATRLAFTGPAARKATGSMAKGPPNSSTTARSRSSSHTETVTKPSSKRNAILLQQPARELARSYRSGVMALGFGAGRVDHRFALLEHDMVIADAFDSDPDPRIQQRWRHGLIDSALQGAEN